MKIGLLGDIALFGDNTVENKTIEEKFASMKAVLTKCDFVVGNLESPLTKHEHTVGGKSAYLKGNPDNVEILKYLGVSHVTLANNHMYDYGLQGLKETIQVLGKNGIEWYGINGKSARILSQGSEITLLGYCCYSTNAKGMGVINVLDPEQVERDLENNKSTLHILSFHWGEEHVHYPNYDHIKVSRKLCKDRKIIIHGHHPHVIQGIEEIGRSVVLYSQGNFCFDDVYTKKSAKPLISLSKDNQESFIFILDIQGSQINGYDIIPFSFQKGVYEIAPEVKDEILNWSEALKVKESEYNKKRNSDLAQYIEGRKSLRNLEWYIKRLNFDSLKMIVGARNNKKKYNEIVKRYILG